MLVLKRKKGEKIKIGENITITVSDFNLYHGQLSVTLGIEAPRELRVDRQEIAEKRLADAPEGP